MCFILLKAEYPLLNKFMSEKALSPRKWKISLRMSSIKQGGDYTKTKTDSSTLNTLYKGAQL